MGTPQTYTCGGDVQLTGPSIYNPFYLDLFSDDSDSDGFFDEHADDDCTEDLEEIFGPGTIEGYSSTWNQALERGPPPPRELM